MPRPYYATWDYPTKLYVLRQERYAELIHKPEDDIVLATISEDVLRQVAVALRLSVDWSLIDHASKGGNYVHVSDYQRA